MSMTVAYLKSKGTPIQPIKGQKYRIVGKVYIQGGIFEIQDINGDNITLKGYIEPISLKENKFYQTN